MKPNPVTREWCDAEADRICAEYAAAYAEVAKYDVLDTLGHNLAQAAALCWAFELGDAYQRDAYRTGAKYAWRPGCGRDAK